MNDAGARFCGADKRQSGGQQRLREHRLHLRFHADAVLDEQHEGVGLQERRQQVLEQRVVDRFQRDDHHVARGHIGAVVVGVHPVQMKVSPAGIHLQAVFAHEVVIFVQEEVDLLSRTGEAAAVIAADTSRSYDGINHLT